MIPEDIRAEIVVRLNKAAVEHSVRILFAIESGSRAWGFSSPNSDYDVRFIYAHEPRWYQAVDLEERRDVIEYPIVDDIDLNGWDVRKALRLFWKSNPAFVEWIQSPIVYTETSEFRAQAIQALPRIYAPEKGIYHYRSMAKTNYRGYLREPMVRLKKYFYVLRPLLAAKWIETKRSAAPIEFERLLELLADQDLVLDAIHALLEQKRSAPELGVAPAVPVLNEFIEAALSENAFEAPEKSRSPVVIDLLNEIFHSTLREHELAPSPLYPRLREKCRLTSGCNGPCGIKCPSMRRQPAVDPGSKDSPSTSSPDVLVLISGSGFFPLCSTSLFIQADCKALIGLWVERGGCARARV